MRKFRFKFEPILKQRKSREEDARAALARAQRTYQAELDRKAKLRADLDGSLLRRERLGSSPIDIVPFKVEDDFIVGTKQRILQQEQAIFRASKAVEKTLRAYLFARRQTRTIEVLREKAYADFRREVIKKEQREMDDLSIMRARMAERFSEGEIA
jgi:flagellar FliJ protein